MHILITGAAGYIGSVLTRHLLNAGHRITALDRFFFGRASLSGLEPHPQLTLSRNDVRDISVEDLKGVDAVCDLAALSNDPSGDLDPALTVAINLEARKRLSQLARTAGVKRYILASSCSVYGSTEGDIVTEDATPKPLTIYARCNAEAEEAVFSAADNGMCVSVLRNATVFGLSPRMRFDLIVNIMTLHAVQRGKILILGGGRQWRPLVHVEDVARTMEALLQAPTTAVSGQVFNCGLANLQVRSVAYAVRETLPFRVEIEAASDDADKRDYRVSFAKLQKLIDTSTFRDIPSGITQIYDALKTGETEDEPTTRTVNWYRHLLQAKALVDDVSIKGRLF